jgi:hypothetical protein
MVAVEGRLLMATHKAIIQSHATFIESFVLEPYWSLLYQENPALRPHGMRYGRIDG